MRALLALLAAWLAALSVPREDGVNIDTDTEFAGLANAYESGDEAEPLHLVCAYCWPRDLPPGQAITACGQQTKGGPVVEAKDAAGEYMCAECVALGATSPLPCGHP